jgi:glycosyltransferase involved in cell wall biosynthesis
VIDWPILSALDVIELTADYPPDAWSGIGTAVHQQATSLAALGARVLVAVAGPRASFGALPQAAGNLSVCAIDGDRLSVDPTGFEWIHLHSLPLAELALTLRRRYGCKLAYTVHTQPWLELPGDRRARFWLDVQAQLLASSDRVIFPSEAERRSAQALFPSLARTHVIPNGLPAAPESVPGSLERDLVVFAGRFARSKGLALLEQCLAHMVEHRDIRFLLAGGHGDGEGTASAQRLVRRYPKHGRIAGWVSRPELDAIFGRAALVLLPSLYEPFGMAALEAMRMGGPVLTSKAGGLPEIVTEESGGICIASLDPAEWAGRASEILDNSDLWNALHRRGPEHVNRYFRSSFLARRMIDEVYN